MIFKWPDFCLLFGVIFLLSCSTDPVDVNTNILPLVTGPYKEHGLIMMLADSAGYIAASGHNLFRIAPESPDTAGNVVSYVGQYFSSIYGLFNDDFNRKSIITGNGIYSFDENFSATLQVEFFPPESLNISHLSIDWKGQCWFFKQSASDRFQVYRYATGIVRQCVDSYTRNATPDMHFAAADDRFAVSYRICPWETWLNLFVNDSLNREIKLFSETDSAYISGMWYVGSDLQIIAECWIGLMIKFNNQDSIELTIGTNIIKITREGTIRVHHGEFPLYVYFNKARTFYRSSKETWLFDTCAYCLATPDTIIGGRFRDSYANRFNVPCFKDSSEVQFFDEITQRFIKIK
jgi:hypothetical protein